MKNNLPVLLLLIIISAALYAFVSVPMYGAARAKYDHIEHLQETLMQGEELQERRDMLLSQRNGISRDKRDLLERAIVRYSFSEVIRFMIGFNAMLSENPFGSNAPYSLGGESRRGDGTVVIPITFNFDDIRYPEIGEFINHLRRWERGVRIVSLQITSAGGEGDTETDIRATMSIEALFSGKIRSNGHSITL